MDTTYLKACVGDFLTRALAEVAEKRPTDPIEFIAQCLYKYVENQNFIKQKKNEIAELERQKTEHDKEKVMKEKRNEEAMKLARKDAENKKVDDEHAHTYAASATKMPIVIETQEPSEEAQATVQHKTVEDAESIDEQKFEVMGRDRAHTRKTKS